MRRGGIAIVLAGLFVTIALAGCSTGDIQTGQPQTETQTSGPLTKSEKAFIKAATATHKLAAETVAVLVVHARHMRRGTATSEQDTGARKIYNAVVKSLRGWDDMERPSERVRTAWNLWHKVLNDDLLVLNRYAAFHNDIGSDAKMDAFLNVVLKPRRDYTRFMKEVKRIKLEARSG